MGKEWEGGVTWGDVSEAAFVVEREYAVRIQFIVEQTQHSKTRSHLAVTCRAFARTGAAAGTQVATCSLGYPNVRAKTMSALFERVLYDLQQRLEERRQDGLRATQSALPLL